MNIIDERENEMPCEDTISIHCKDTISRQAVDKIINDLFEYDNMPSPIWQGLRMIKSLPSVTPQDRKLDKIRAEIEALEYLNIEDGSGGFDKYIEQYEALKIIDKYSVESKE